MKISIEAEVSGVKSGKTFEVYLGGNVIVRRKFVGGLLTAVAASGLIFAGSAPAAAEVAPHEHCLLTPDGYVPIAGGVSEEAPNLALEQFHLQVHWGVPGYGLDGVPRTGDELVTIVRVAPGADCPPDPVPAG